MPRPISLPKGYVISRDSRVELIGDEWHVVVLKVHEEPNVPKWEEVAYIEKVYDDAQHKYVYAGRKAGSDRVHVHQTDNLRELVIRLCTLHRMGVKQ